MPKPKAKIEVNLKKALDQFLNDLPIDEVGYVIPTYTALLELRAILAKQTKLTEIWQ